MNIRPDDGIKFYDKRTKYGRLQRKMKFKVNREECDMSCTDLRWRAVARKGDEVVVETLENINDLVLTIGLTRRFRGKFWPMVIAVHTRPIFDVEVDYGKL
jgi:hypothetical protein